VKLVPVRVTLLPTAPLLGAKLLIVGAAETVKLVLLVAVPPGVLTPIGPVVAPAATLSLICVREFDDKIPGVPLQLPAFAPVKLVPVRVTLVPSAPLLGAKLVIAGAAAETLKLALLVEVPPGVVTPIGPVVAPAGTVAVICVPEFTVKTALAPLKVTAVAPVKLVPVIVTTVPAGPPVGVKLVMAGAGVVTVKLVLLVAVPPRVVTRIGPVVAPAGTSARIEVAESTMKAALTVLKATAVAPVKLVPVIVTTVPAGPLAGVKLVMVGADTVKLVLLVAVPPGVVTRIGPVVAPAGASARIEVAESTMKPALTVLKLTAVVPVKLVPVIVTAVPTGPLAGVKLAIVGAGVLNVTLLSVLVEAVLVLPAASLAPPAAIVALTVPLLVMPLTATV